MNMNVRLGHLLLRTRKTTEEVTFSSSVTFLYGPVGTGKSTVARLIDYCLGGDLERTPAIQQEFISVTLTATIGQHECTFERGAEDTQAVRVSWTLGQSAAESINAPLEASDEPIVGSDIYNLSDLLFYLSGVEPIKVPKRTRDPDSPMIRLSFRDVWWYCYLDQTHLDSSLFRLEDPFRGRKSQDAMRFFTGLHSERLSQVQADLYRAIAEQQGTREAVAQIRRFMARFKLGSELEIAKHLEVANTDLEAFKARRESLEETRSTNLHPSDSLRVRLRQLSQTVGELQEATVAVEGKLHEQEALRAELITVKIKSSRAEQAGQILEGVEYAMCPQCGADVTDRPHSSEHCCLCGSSAVPRSENQCADREAVRRELNDRIDQIADSIRRTRQALERLQRELKIAEQSKIQLDQQLQQELARYDSAFIESIREVDRGIATLEERCRALIQLQEMPRAIGELEEQAAGSQQQIDRFRIAIDEERQRLGFAEENARRIAEKFKAIMLDVGFPGVSAADHVVLDPRNWRPVVVHSGYEWGFWDTGSGGKKTLFNVCYALAVHVVAQELGLPVPNILIIDSPTKNISDDENPEIVQSLYRVIYQAAMNRDNGGIQFLLIDSDLVEPEEVLSEFSHRRLASEPDAPSLISYYAGP